MKWQRNVIWVRETEKKGGQGERGSFFSVAVAFPLEVLRAACIEPEGSGFESPNEDLLLTAARTEWHL